MNGNFKMKVYKYKDYDHYVEEQTKANIRKLHWVYVKEHTIQFISKQHPFASSIICHGTRNAAEQKFFKKYYPNAQIIGTEISETAKAFPMTIQHDFAIQKENWIGKFDIVYSNSFDHSIDPNKTLVTWRDQLSSSGKMFIEYSEEHSEMTPSDPLEATHKEFKELLSNNKLMAIGKPIVGKRKGSLLYTIVKE